MRRLSLLILLCAVPAALYAQLPPPVKLPPVRGFYVDPVSGNRIWRVTDKGLCPKGAKHFYSYWPVWNQDGSYFLIECAGWSQASSNALLIRDADLKVIGDALRGAPDLNRGKLIWSWKDRNTFFGASGGEVWRWDPFQKKGKMVFRLPRMEVNGMNVHSIRLAYLSFDDRYLLVELRGPNLKKQKSSPWDTIGLLTFDLQDSKAVGTLDLTAFLFYDESVFAKDNSVWVRVNDERDQAQGFRYSLDFSRRIRVAEGGHYAHGILPDGRPVVVKESGNRDCPPGSPSGNPRDPEYPAKGWKPTALILDARVDTSGAQKNAPLANELFRLGCNVPGQHEFGHYSWNNTDRDRFFVSTWSYNGFDGNPIADAVIRVRLQFSAAGAITGEQIDFLAHHRSEKAAGYFASPRASCNQQGTRCLFASSMSVQTSDPRFGPQLYIVDVPPEKKP